MKKSTAVFLAANNFSQIFYHILLGLCIYKCLLSKTGGGERAMGDFFLEIFSPKNVSPGYPKIPVE
jgi:hypothetical protein